MAKNATTGYSFTKDAIELASRISILGARATGLVADLHITLAGVIMHSIEHGDITLIQKMDDAINDGLWKRGMRGYIDKYAPVTFVKKAGKGDAIVPSHWEYSKDKLTAILAKDQAAYVAHLIATPYYVDQQQKSDDFKGLSTVEMLGRIIKQHERVSKDTDKSKHPENNFVGIEDIKHLYAKLKDKAPVKPVVPTPAVPAAIAAPANSNEAAVVH